MGYLERTAKGWAKLYVDWPYDVSHLFIPTRIDFFLTSRALNQFITAVEFKPYKHSDHDCITLEIDFDKVHRGPGYWHFNNDLLTDVDFLICLPTLFSWSSKMVG